MKQILLSISVTGILLLSACGSPTAAPEVEAPATSEAQLIAEWAGIGPKTTEPFTIDDESWVIDWVHVPSVINNQSIGTFQIMVYNTENPDIPVAIAANSKEKESDTYYMQKTGTFYLLINAANTRWSVKVLVTFKDSVD